MTNVTITKLSSAIIGQTTVSEVIGQSTTDSSTDSATLNTALKSSLTVSTTAEQQSALVAKNSGDTLLNLGIAAVGERNAESSSRRSTFLRSTKLFHAMKINFTTWRVQKTLGAWSDRSEKGMGYE